MCRIETTDFRVKVTSDTGEEDLPADQAVKLVVSGEVALAEDQQEPPTELVSHLHARLERVEDLGPSAVGLKVLTRLSEQLVRNGIRQGVFEEQQLEWLMGPAMAREFRRRLFGAPGRTDELQAMAEAVWRFHLEQRSVSQQKRHKASDDTVQKYGLFLKRAGVQRSTGRRDNGWSDPRRFRLWDEPNASWEYAEVGPAWLVYRQSLDQLERGLEVALRLALQEGRILCVEETNRGDRLLAPREAAELRLRRKGTRRWYLFTSGFPIAMCAGQADLARLRGEAKDIIERAGNLVEALGKRASAAQLKALAGERTGLTEHALDQVWKTVQFPQKSAKGTIPEKLRISHSEIRALIK